MQKNNLMKGLISALLLVSPVVGAGTYPPPFEPSVVYRDNDYIAKQSPTAPAAPAQAPAKSAPADTTKYPAEFKAEVLYQDPAAISKPSAATAAGAKSEVETSTASESEAAPSSASPLADNLPVIGVGVGLVLFVVFMSKKGAKKDAPSAQARAAESVAAPAPVVGGDTGVARYLKGLPGAGETGVAKYLKSLSETAVAAAETGVAKYLKNLPAAAAAAETGVAKYLKKVDSASS